MNSKNKIMEACCIRSCLTYGSETWPMKLEHEVKLDRNKMIMLRWMFGFNLTD